MKKQEIGLYQIDTKFDTFYVIAFNASEAIQALVDRFSGDKLEDLKGVTRLTEMTYQIIMSVGSIEGNRLVVEREVTNG